MIGDIIIIQEPSRKVKKKHSGGYFMEVFMVALAFAGIYGLYRFDIWLQN